MAEGQQAVVATVVSKVQQRQYILYGIFIGLGIGWWWGGFQGDTTGYLMIAAVGIYIWYNSRVKPKAKNIYDVARELAMLHKEKTGLALNWKTVQVFWRGGDIHFFQFTNPTMTLTWRGKVSGPHEITPRSGEGLKTEKDNLYLETREYEIE